MQARLDQQINNYKTTRTESEALLTGRIFDHRGNRMSPSHARKGNAKYRYYLSSALLQGLPKSAGAVSRVPAAQIEDLVTRTVRDHIRPVEPTDHRSLIIAHVARLTVQPDQIVIHLLGAPKGPSNRKPTRANGVLRIPWRKVSSRRRREILLPEGISPQMARPIRAETRATLVTAIARGRRWLDELITDTKASAETIAKREGCSARKVNVTISLGFLSPDLVKAAIEGRLSHGVGTTRLTDLPAEWSKQREVLGLPAQ